MLSNNVPCPHCGESVKCDPGYAGETGTCPSCQQVFEMPVTELELLRQIRNHASFLNVLAQLILAALVVQIALFALTFVL